MKLYNSENGLIVERAPNETRTVPSPVSFHINNGLVTLYGKDNSFKYLDRVLFSDIQDATGTPYASIEAIEAVLSSAIAPLKSEFMQRVSIAVGNNPNMKGEYKFGSNDEITTDRTIVSKGTTIDGLQAATTVDVYSASADDVNLTGEGAWDVEISGLDENLNEASEVINLNGATKVTSTKTYRIVFRGSVLNGGSQSPTAGANQGAITCEKTGASSVVFWQIAQYAGQTSMAMWCVPNGYKALVLNADANAGKGADAIFEFKRRLDGVNTVWKNSADRIVKEGSFNREYDIPRLFESGTCIAMIGRADTGTVYASASFEILLIKESYIAGL